MGCTIRYLTGEGGWAITKKIRARLQNRKKKSEQDQSAKKYSCKGE